MFDVTQIRSDFPIFSRKIHGYPLAYLDNAATTQKPRQVVEAIQDYYFQHNANVNRGVHTLAEESTHAYEEARKTVAQFIGAQPEEVIFVRNTTEALNLVVYGWGLKHLKKGDEVILTQMEHHSNIVPWQMLASRVGIVLRFIQMDGEGELNLGRSEKLKVKSEKLNTSTHPDLCLPAAEIGGLKSLLTDKTRFVSLVHISNTLGVINPVAEIIRVVKKFNKDIICMVDGAQSVPHLPTDVRSSKFKVQSSKLEDKNTKTPSTSVGRHKAQTSGEKETLYPKPYALNPLACDFLAFSGHKMLGPMGIGVLWGRKKLLEAMDPFLGGGDMIAAVYLNQTTYNKIPEKFEAGTPNVADAVGLAAAITYLSAIKNGGVRALQAIHHHEQALTQYLVGRLSEFKAVTILGPKDLSKRAGLVAFEFEGVHAHDVAQVMDSLGIAVRSGHHCTMPLHKHLQIPASTRVSFYLYNTQAEVDRVIEGLEKVKKVFSI